MPKVVYSDNKGLVQEAGSGFSFVTGALADKVGLHLYQEEVTLTKGAANKVAARLSKSLPANSVILNIAATTATAANGAAKANITIHNVSSVAVGDNSAGTEVLGEGSTGEIPSATDIDLATSGKSLVNTLGSSVGSNVYVYVNNADNNAAITNSPTVIVSILYAGKGEPAVI